MVIVKRIYPSAKNYPDFAFSVVDRFKSMNFQFIILIKALKLISLDHLKLIMFSGGRNA